MCVHVTIERERNKKLGGAKRAIFSKYLVERLKDMWNVDITDGWWEEEGEGEYEEPSSVSFSLSSCANIVEARRSQKNNEKLRGQAMQPILLYSGMEECEVAVQY